MKVWIWCDERYPDYGFSDHSSIWGTPAELTDAEIADYEHVCSEYERWQKRLSELERSTPREGPADVATLFKEVSPMSTPLMAKSRG